MLIKVINKLDETGTEKTKSYIFNVRSFTNITYIGHHSGTATATDQIKNIKGNLVFQKNFSAGLQVLRIDILGMKLTTQVLRILTYTPQVTVISPMVHGGGDYPYFPSGNIILSWIKISK
jgi:hypothetical protein